MMKKTFAGTLILFSALLYAQWDQLLLPQDSSLYGMIDALTLDCGSPLFPEGTHRPWTYSEAEEQLRRIPYDLLSDRGKTIYQKAMGDIKKESLHEEENLAFGLSLQTAPSLFYRYSSAGDAADPEHLVYDSKNRESFLTIPFQFSFYDNLAMEAVYSFIEEPREDEKAMNITNLPLNTYDIDWNLPKRAYVSYGRDSWNILAGRIRNDWGSGYMGNLFLSDSLNFHDTFRARAYWERFGYSFLFLSLENRLNGNQETLLATLNPGKDYSDGISHGGKYFWTHTFDFILGDNLHLGITEGLIFGGYDFTLTPAYFNPMMLYHNWFTNIPGEGNAIHQIELKYNKGRNSYYFQTVLDQFQAPTEKDYAPFTFGLLTRFSRDSNMAGGYLIWGAEAIWTSPYLYTNTNGNYYLTVSGNEYHLTGTTEEVPLGYYEGPDRIALSLHGRYVSDKSWETEGELRYTLRGPVTIYDPYPWTEEEAHGLDRNRLTPSLLTDEQEFRIDWSGKYGVNQSLAIKLRLTPLYLVNRLDGKRDSFSLESGITLYYNL